MAASAQAKTAISYDENVYRSWQDPLPRVPSMPLSYLQALCLADVATSDRKVRAGEFVSARARKLLSKVKRRFIRPLEELPCTSLHVFFCHFTLRDFSMPMAPWSWAILKRAIS